MGDDKEEKENREREREKIGEEVFGEVKRKWRRKKDAKEGQKM